LAKKRTRTKSRGGAWEGAGTSKKKRQCLNSWQRAVVVVNGSNNHLNRVAEHRGQYSSGIRKKARKGTSVMRNQLKAG